jgi:phosphohistidine swiveling domain-containing protein
VTTETSIRHVLLPDEVTPETPVGGKARALAQMTEAELPVPPWVVVLPSAFYASVSPEIAERVREGRGKPREIVAGVRLSHEISKELSRALSSLAPAGSLWAVRSSALEEDSARLSFAGQLESFLFVDPKKVADRIVSVWASGFNERLMQYRREFGLDPMASVPAAIVQVMIDGEASGVAFSADPVSGRWAVAVVGAVPGLGNALVSGEAAADTWRVDRAGVIVDRTIVTKPVMHQRDPNRPEGVKAVAVPDDLAAEPSLDDDQVRQVVTLARRAERFFGRPQDIEWTWAGRRLYLLQSRPITTLAERADPDGRAALWDNSNIIESYSGVTTPMTFSFARKAYENVYREFCRLMKVPRPVIETNAQMFCCMIGLIRGRVYYNLYNWYRLLSLLPGYRFNRRFMEQMLGVGETLAEDLTVGPHEVGTAARFFDAIRFASAVASVAGNVITLRVRIARFYRRLRECLGEKRPDFSDMNPHDLVAYYRGLEQRLLTHWDAPVVNDFATMIFHGLLRRLCAQWVGDKEGTLPNALLCAERGMISEEPARRVRAMAQLAAGDPALTAALCEEPLHGMRAAIRRSPSFQASFDSYLEKFGDRCMGELKLESSTLYDDPTPLLRSVGQYARSLAQEGTRSERVPELQVREQAEARARGALIGRPWRRLMFGYVLRVARARVLARENLRFERTRVFGRARQIVLEIGKRLAALDCLDDARDIFYLEFDEMLVFIEGRATTTNLKGLAAVRKAEFDGWLKMPAPADRFRTRGIVYRGNSFSGDHAVVLPTGDSLAGIGCCPGVVRGPVHIVRNPHDAAVKPGEIIVADRTDPGWVMIFPVISGLLVERGSLLSHSAIVARELNLPTIVALPGVTTWLKDNDWVEMDGSTGVVVKIESPKSSEAEAACG